MHGSSEVGNWTKKNLEIFSCQTQHTSETKEGEKVCQKYKNKF